MRISHIMIGSMVALFLIFAIYGIVTFDLSIQEMKKLLTSRNEGFAFNMMQDLDQRIENRISDLQKLTQVSEIQDALIESNEKFQGIENLKEFLNLKEQEIEFTETPFVSPDINAELSKDLRDTIQFYQDEYNFDVFEELFVTNSFGANVALGSGFSDYLQDDEDWWITARETGIFYGDLKYRNEYDNYALGLAFRINDEQNNFLGVMRVLVTLDDILDSFVRDAELLDLPTRNVILIDEGGNIIYSDTVQNLQDSTIIPYFDSIVEGKDVGSFELGAQDNEIQLISYAKSTGYKSFGGFDWVVIVDQSSSSFVDEFLVLRNSILLVSLGGMIASIALGFGISRLVSSPLKELSKLATIISKGDFSVRTKKIRVSEIQIIGDSFNKMANSLGKLMETEKKLAEANAKVKNERFTAIGELAANVAHDLKNPLATVRSSAEIIKRSTKTRDPEIDKVMLRMDRAISRMSHQIEDVLNYARTTPINISNVSIKSLINSSIDILEIPKNITIETTNTNEQITCDAQKMEIVFTNVLLNAIQSIGTKEGKITIRTKKEESFTTIEFEDSGEGIPPKILDRIFDPLVTTKEQGTGLGLSSCKNIVEQHGGIITVKNNPTTFFIKIPNFVI